MVSKESGMMSDRKKAYIAITLQSLIIGFSFLFVKLTLKSADTFTLLAHRFTVAAIFLFIYKFFSKDFPKVSIKDFFKILPYSLGFPIIFFLFQTLGLERITSTEAGIVQATLPILTLIAAGIILKEKISRMQKIFILTSVAGVIFINIMDGVSLHSDNFIGLIYILGSAVAFAVYSVLIKKISSKYSTMQIVYVVNVAGFIFFNVISLYNHISANTIFDYFAPFAEKTFLLPILYLGILSSVITSILLTYAVSKIKATTVGLFNNLTSVIAIISGGLFLGEKLMWYDFAGIAVVLISTAAFSMVKTDK